MARSSAFSSYSKVTRGTTRPFHWLRTQKGKGVWSIYHANGTNKSQEASPLFLNARLLIFPATFNSITVNMRKRSQISSSGYVKLS